MNYITTTIHNISRSISTPYVIINANKAGGISTNATYKTGTYSLPDNPLVTSLIVGPFTNVQHQNGLIAANINNDTAKAVLYPINTYVVLLKVSSSAL